MKPHIKEKLTSNKLRTTNLQLVSGRIDKIPKEILEFENLKYLDMFDNNISYVPNEIYKLSNLEHLSLNKNRLTELPSVLFLLPNLKSLSLKDNRITSIVGEKYSELFKIKKIDLSHNSITSFAKFGTLLSSQTEELLLKGNSLSKFPEIISSITSLKKLNLSENKIEHLPDDIFDGLLNLEELDLSLNRLTYLPTSIGKLTKLRYLNLSGNRIPTLPIEIENLVSLEKLELLGNPIERAPVEIEAQGTQGIINYYLSLGENVKLYEAKLLIVGQGNVGKTFLMNRLVYGKTPVTKTTEGIDIEAWYTNTESSEKFRINIWDFGGQEIYHSTHQFFLTKRSLYLLVWEARTDQHLISFDYWLNVIRLLSNESPTLMVLNKIDERIVSIDERSLKEKFKNIVSFHQVSAETGKNIDTLTEDIQKLIDKLPLIGDRLPKVWVEIREELESLMYNEISLNAYLVICNKHGLSNKKALFLSQYFHDLGVFLHFQEHFMLKNIVFLKPEWATNAVYKIMDAKSIIENNGEFSSSDLDTILEDYPIEKHPYLIELMKKFELCFQLDANKFLVPELLKPEKVAFDWDYSDNLRFEYHYDFMPAGILARFIVRVREMVDSNSYWKNGVIIKREQTQALVISDQFSRKIQIWVNGQNKAFLLEIIRKELQHINNTLNYPLVPEKIPCNCPKCEKSSTPHLFNYKFVKDSAINNTFRTIPCEKGNVGVNVFNLMGLYSISGSDTPEIKYSSENALYDLIEISSRMLERKRVKKIEDLWNDDFTDLLRTKGYTITDQTRSGASGSDAETAGAGEIDMMIRNNRGMPISILECFRLESCGEKNTVVDKHIDKLLHKYDTHGIKRNFVIVFSEAKNFSKLWENYTAYLNDLNNKDNFSGDYPFCGLTRMPEISEQYTDLRVVIARHERSGEEIEVVHVVLNFSHP